MLSFLFRKVPKEIINLLLKFWSSKFKAAFFCQIDQKDCRKTDICFQNPPFQNLKIIIANNNNKKKNRKAYNCSPKITTFEKEKQKCKVL